MKELPIDKIPKSTSDMNDENHRVQGLRVLAVIIAREYLARMRVKNRVADGSTRKQQ